MSRTVGEMIIAQFLRYGMDLMENLESHRKGTVGLFASPIYRKKLREKETEWKELNDEIAVNLKLGGRFAIFKYFLEFFTPI